MNTVLISCALALLGLMMGSFAGASIWRLRAKQLIEDKAEGEKIDARELKKLKPLIAKSVKQDRSVCLHCKHQLAWYDLLPVISWSQLRGKCRYCRKPIGWFEPVIEVTTAAFFVTSYLAWPLPLTEPLGVSLLALWLLASVGLIMLFWYDAKWFLLPNAVMYPLLLIALISTLVTIFGASDKAGAALSVLIGCTILSGLYFALYVVSRGAWIGFGDIKLGLVLALLLADWKHALLALFLANVIGCIIVLPAMVLKRVTRTTHIPFGPMLIAGWAIAGLFGNAIIEWYLQISLLIPV